MIIHLHPNEGGHWALYELFERRCIEFGDRSGWPVNQVFRQEMRRRWIEAPTFAGYFLSEGRDAHLLSWFVTVFGEPGIVIYQAAGSPGVLIPLLTEFFDERLPKWIQGLEALIKQPVQFVEYDTERPEEWKRALRPFRIASSERVMTTIRFDAKSKE